MHLALSVEKQSEETHDEVSLFFQETTTVKYGRPPRLQKVISGSCLLGLCTGLALLTKHKQRGFLAIQALQDGLPGRLWPCISAAPTSKQTAPSPATPLQQGKGCFLSKGYTA